MHTRSGIIKGPPPGGGETLFATPDPFGPFKGPLIKFNPNAPPNSVSAAVTEAVVAKINTILRGMGDIALDQTTETGLNPFSDN